jgi:hypothetical protein
MSNRMPMIDNATSPEPAGTETALGPNTACGAMLTGTGISPPFDSATVTGCGCSTAADGEPAVPTGGGTTLVSVAVGVGDADVGVGDAEVGVGDALVGVGDGTTIRQSFLRISCPASVQLYPGNEAPESLLNGGMTSPHSFMPFSYTFPV